MNKPILTIFNIIFIITAAVVLLAGFPPSPAVAAGTLAKPTAEATSKQVFYLTFNEPLNGATVNTTNIQVYKDGTAQPLYSVSLMPDYRIIKAVLASDTVAGSAYAPVAYWVYLNNIASSDNTKTLTTNDTVNSPAPSFEAFTPHGKYAPPAFNSGSTTRLCGLCHSAHSSNGTQLLSAASIQKVCFICHGPTSLRPPEYTAPGWTVAVNVYDDFQRSGSIHRALDTSPNDVLTCIDCHNPHGDRIPGQGNTVYSKLLKANLNGTSYYQGNDFCFACHGLTDRAFAKDVNYYVYTGGRHDSFESYDFRSKAVHYNTSIQNGAMVPPSGTGITCVMCHDKHGSRFDSLVNNSVYDPGQPKSNINQACFKCHGADYTYSRSPSYTTPGNRIYDRFTNTFPNSSRHNIFDPVVGLTCTSCHGPHSIDQNSFAGSKATTLSDISNPYNTKEPFKKTVYPGGPEQRFSAFCIKCHDGDTPPVGVTNQTTIVPSTITFPDIAFTSNTSKWDKSGFVNSGHYNAGLTLIGECNSCHEPHGTNYKWLVKYNVDDNITNSFANGACFNTCHEGSFRNDISAAKPYGHPTFSVNGEHSNTEAWGEDKDIPRHAECFDCHDVHTAARDSSSETSVNGRVTGIVVSSWGNTSWSNWSNVSPEWSLEGLSSSSGKQWQLCLKCHSKFSYDLVQSAGDVRAPHTNRTDTSYKQTDIARDFNPNNPAYHAVIGVSKMPDSYGEFVSPWSADSTLKCTDCHNRSNYSGVIGPHGSDNRYILKAPWYPVNPPSGRDVTGSGNGDSGDLCFSCHDYDFYTGVTQSVYSQFSTPTVNNLHNADHRKGCAKCHGGLPHGWKHTDNNGGGVALADPTAGLPYSEGLSGANYYKGTDGVDGAPGSWTCNNCHSE